MNTLCQICQQDSGLIHLLDTQCVDTLESFSIKQCSNCGVKKIDPQPQDLSKYYSSDFGQKMRVGSSKVYGFFKNILLNKEFSRIRRDLTEYHFLDIGCGFGDFTKLISDKGFRVSAVDSCKKSESVFADSSIPYYEIDYENIKIKNYQPVEKTTAILRHVLEHIRNPRNFLEYLMESKVESFYIVVPNMSNSKTKLFGKYYSHWAAPIHLWHFDQITLSTFFKSLNLKVLGMGFDTIPTIVPSLYDYIRINRYPESIYKWFEPKGAIATLSLPLDWLMPSNVLWFLVKKQ